jgi:hypothetical protein
MVLNDDELDDCLSAMEMFALQASHGKGIWDEWHCKSAFAGRLAETIRELRSQADAANV